MWLRSASFEPGGPLSKRHTADGLGLSPALSWAALPPGTRELVLIVDDPDAMGPTPWVHWLLYGIPPSPMSIAEGVPPVRNPMRPSGSMQGFNTWGCIGYRGPAPPPGSAAHRYRFVLHALDTRLRLDPGIDVETLRAAMEHHVLTRAELTGTYAR